MLMCFCADCGGRGVLHGSVRCAACSVRRWRGSRLAPSVPVPAPVLTVIPAHPNKYETLMAADYLARNPQCHDCRAAPSTTLYREHRMREDGKNYYTHRRALCDACHERRKGTETRSGA